MASHPLRIGVLAHTPVQQYALGEVIESCGLTMAARVLIDQIHTADSVADEPVDAWVVHIEPGTEDNEHMEAWLDQWQIPVIFCDGVIPATNAEDYPAWHRRLVDKLTQLAGTIKLAEAADSLAQQVWVLGASTGGPAAVQEFLQALPAGLKLGFIYVQHIDTGYHETLQQMMSRQTPFSARVVEHGDVLQTDQVAIVSPDRATTLRSNGTFSVADHPWEAPYSPSVDAMVADVAHGYGNRSGVIIFSGMGNDGAASARLMQKRGGKVWAQSPDSCTTSAMPDAVIATGRVSFKGTPHDLAQQLVQEARLFERRRQPQLGLI